MPSFTVPCPSCEAKVLIKNPKLAGTKVECPKCKYRFVAEAPKDAAEGDAAKPAAAETKDKKATDKKAEKGKDKAAVGAAAEKPEKGKKKAAGKKNNKKLVGMALGVGAVFLLAIGAFVVLGGGDDDKGSGSGGFGGGGGGSGYVAGDGSDPDGTDGENKDKKLKKQPRVPFSTKEPTNLLPGQSVAVYRVDVGNLSQSPLGGPLLDQSMSDLFRTSLGLDPSEVDLYYHCVVGAKERAPFGVIRIKEPKKPEEIIPKVAGLANQPVNENNYALYSLKANPFVDAVSSAFAFDSLMADVYEKAPTGEKQQSRPIGFCVYDTQTILIGDHAVVKGLLASLKDGYPPFQTVYRKMEPPPKPKDPMMDPMMADPMVDMTATGESAPMPMPKPPPKPEPPLNKDFTTNPTYLSVSSELKNLMNILEEETGGPPLLLIAEKFDSKLYERKNIKPAYDAIVKKIDPVLDRTSMIGVNLTQFHVHGVRATIRVVGRTGEDARTIALEHLSPALLEAVPVLSLMLSDLPLIYTPIQFRNYADPMKSYPQYGGTGEYPGGFPGLPGSGMPYGPEMGSPDGAPGPGALPGGMPFAAPGQFPPGAFPQPGGFPQPGVFPQPGLPGEGPMPGMEGDPNMMQRMPPPEPAHIDLRLIDTSAVISVDLKWPDQIYGQVIAPRLIGLMNQIRGKASVFAGHHTWHSLAQAVKKYVEQNKKFPRGTLERPADEQTRVGLPYPPITRVSFFLELLPYLGKNGVSQSVNPRLAWFDDKNSTATGSWVPELLVSYYPQTSWRAHSPLAPEHTFGGTNYVAIAGVGNDAARYDPARNPNTAKLAGISGYDWGSEIGEVSDGLENTIYLMQVPPGFSRPWAAGGGATVVGLDPEKPMESFKHQRPDGKWGTYAIMGDGTVRWIPADIDPKTFLAMATRAGGEKLPDLDAVAPRIDPPGAKAEVKAKVEPTERPSANAAGGPVEIAPAPREK